ncbi:cleft lip and palate transmembrane protein 1-like protein [Limulus polyphemus]|uniref:Lipid scramblase CLPTM1L n=1 Tax=Limulus polyphemus TaxID=6850 RepID=A0ABM1S2L2_LIMPO|nr:cleft lip and palate transmembrane protein 1-like protein [Limulus polyphemus]XP_022237867.1 cleft lip and palate transmembrane protein 1-like protein [Limulus polyphemus]
MRPSLTVILSVVFVSYIFHSIWTIYQLYNPKPCPPKEKCLKPSWKETSRFQVYLCTSLKLEVKRESELTVVWSDNDFDISVSKDIPLNISLPRSTIRNGSLSIHAFITPKQNRKRSLSELVGDSRTSHGGGLLTKYVVPTSQAFNLLKNDQNKEDPKKQQVEDERPFTHWKPNFAFHVMFEPLPLYKNNIPGEIFHLLVTNEKREYLPIVFASELSYRIKDLVPLNTVEMVMPLTVSYTPISLGRLRLMVTVEHAMKSLEKAGFTPKDTDEIKGIFFDTNIYLLLLTFFVSAFHLLFDFLAFKNDIRFWREKKSMVGMSVRTIIWRSISQVIVFLYLLDEDTSLLVLIPSGIASVIEFWKVTKALKLHVTFKGIIPNFRFESSSASEKQTEEYDSQSMKYLSFLLYPLCLGGAVYSLFYVQHKSWYSWCIHSLVNGVYAFGFLFMLPQLFVNYKLKSVAHLPWRAFMYKAFNTFIDDLFAFIITMPTAHRVACFRDDIVFLIYLYQRWLYPVDRSRVNEFGESYGEKNENSKKDK